MTEPNSELLIEDDSRKKVEEEESRAEKSRVSFDDVLKELGEFGPYQRKIYFLVSISLQSLLKRKCSQKARPFHISFGKWSSFLVHKKN